MSNSTGVRLILDYVKLLEFVNLGLFGAFPTPRLHDWKSIFFLKNEYWKHVSSYSTSWKCTVISCIDSYVSEDTQFIVCFHFYKCLHGISPKAMNLCWSVAVIDGQSLRSTARVQLDVTHLKTSTAEELSRSLAHQHGTHYPTTLKTAALLLLCLDDH